MKTNHRRKNKRPTKSAHAGLITKKLTTERVGKFWENHYDGNQGASRNKKATKRYLNKLVRIDSEEAIEESSNSEEE